MKIIGLNNAKLVNIVECSSLEVFKGTSTTNKNKKYYYILLKSAHLSGTYVIDSSQKRPGIDNGLTLDEANLVVETLATKNEIDLRIVGNYRLGFVDLLQSVSVKNSLDDKGDVEPLVVSQVRNKELDINKLMDLLPDIDEIDLHGSDDDNDDDGKDDISDGGHRND